MYLYKWKLSVEEAADLFKGDLYITHKEVWKLFGTGVAERPFLYRDLGNGLLIQSKTPVVNPPTLGVWQGKEISGVLEGMYQLTATVNPVVDKSRLAYGKKNSSRVPLIKESEIASWLTDRLQKNGFSMSAVSISPVSKQVSKSKGITMSVCQVTAVVTVVDAEKAGLAFAQGIGKERAFGCGLLCLTPIDSAVSDASEEIDD